MRYVYHAPSHDEGIKRMSEWIHVHLLSSTPAVRSIAKTSVKWRQPIEAFFLYRVTNAPIEGTHNKVKVIKRRAFGYRNMKRFELRIRLECGAA
jgi:transposase